MTIAAEFLALLTDAVDDIGSDLSTSKEEVAEFMAERALHLSNIAHEPGFGLAVRREASTVAMRAGLEVSETASSLDQRWFGLIGGALRIAAVALL